MKLSILCSSKEHPVYDYIVKWGGYDELKNKAAELEGGDILFLISCSEIVTQETRNKYKKVLVIHASNVPYGRGWSPHIWQIIEGKKDIVLSTLEAEDKVDTGDIWLQQKIHFEGHELYDEINNIIFQGEVEMMDFIKKNFEKIIPKKQQGKASYFPKRSPEDSRLDIDKPLREQLNLLRVSDPNRYPAFFELGGFKYKVTLEKI